MRRWIKKNPLVLCLTVALFCTAGCGAPSPDAAPVREGMKAAGHSGTEASRYCRVRHARGFTVSYHEGYKVVTVFEPGHFEEPGRMNVFVLVPRGTRPRIPPGGTVIEVPVRRVVLRSSSHVPFFVMLGITDRIVGITQGKYVNDPGVAALIRQGRIEELGVGSGMAAQFNMERLLTVHPDLVLSWWTNIPAFDAHSRVREAGLPVALIADYEENTPLGRTEWIKFIAPFFDAEAEAERLFDDIEGRYAAMVEKAANAGYRPTVMYGCSYQGSWYIAGGKSLFASLIKDAGGHYVWDDDTKTGNRPVNTETAMIRGRRADYWFTQNQDHFSLASLAAEDERYKLFTAFRTGRIYSNNAKIGPGGGNDYYQGTAERPDLLLADMIAILHPELLPGYKLIWHLHLPATISDGAAGIRGKRE